MAYSGLVPSEHSSGKRDRRGGITKAGNSHVRRVFVEAAWTSSGAQDGRSPTARRPVDCIVHASVAALSRFHHIHSFQVAAHATQSCAAGQFSLTALAPNL
ncbi:MULTISPECIES: IS110 family transposase [Cupriavidus]|uniref:IS110 family transposase n=1 Tax=Cupriavidus TaxID=106589 RepID=UPI001F28FC7C|nr:MULTISPECIES: IS110 family transposase [Cupriavidus]